MVLRAHALVLALLAIAGPAAIARRAAKPSPCVVPNVKGEKLKKAETRLLTAHCTTGKITGPRTALVSDESPKPGRREKNRAKVALTFKKKASARSGSGQSATSGSGGQSGSASGSGSGGGAQQSGGGSGGSSGGQSTPASTTTDWTPAQLGLTGTWRLVLDSEFNSGSLPSPWRTGWFGSGVTSPVTGTSNELDCYSPSNVTFPGDGTMHLRITAQKSSCGGVTEPYTGSIVTTNPNDGRPAGAGFQYTYGLLEARVYLPGATNGDIANWPGIWANGQTWPTDGEDDLMEGLDGVAYSTYHDNYGNPTRFHDNSIGPGWHTFACDWEPGSITYWYDGIDEGTVTTNITGAPMYLILHNTVNHQYPTLTVAPADMQVDFIKVWQR